MPNWITKEKECEINQLCAEMRFYIILLTETKKVNIEAEKIGRYSILLEYETRFQ